MMKQFREAKKLSMLANSSPPFRNSVGPWTGVILTLMAGLKRTGCLARNV